MYFSLMALGILRFTPGNVVDNRGFCTSSSNFVSNFR